MKQYPYNGRYLSVKEISEECGVPYKTLLQRLYNGFSIEQAVTDDPLRQSVVDFFEASWFKDWVDQPTEAVYTIYWKWCIRTGYSPETKTCLVKSILSRYPDLRVASRNGTRYFVQEW